MLRGKRYRYKAFGLVLDSAVSCAYLPSTEEVQTDVSIDIGQCPENLGDGATGSGLFEVRGREFLLNVPRVARFWVRDGREITVEPHGGLEEEGVRLFLLGSSMGAVLHQRGVLPLHASVVLAPDGRAVAFTGVPGVGKSTLAALLVERGYRLMADDIAPIDLGEEGVRVFSGVPFLKLWDDMFKTFYKEGVGSRSRVREELDKFYIPQADNYSAEPAPLKALVNLTEITDQRLDLSPIKGREKMAVVMNGVYRSRIVNFMGGHPDHFARCLRLSAAIKVLRVERPMEPIMLGELGDLIEREVLNS